MHHACAVNVSAPGREQHNPSLTDDPTHRSGDKVETCHDVFGGKKKKKKRTGTRKGNHYREKRKKAVIPSDVFFGFSSFSSRSVVDVNKNGKTQKQDQTWAFY